MQKIQVMMFTACFLAIGTYVQAQQLAFPGAEGFGRFAKGGRGGAVIHVTNLNDSGPGSYRAALTASGPRTVVFDVSGYINCDMPVFITNPNITIAGQTAPSPGVTVKCPLLVEAHQAIIRYLRIRPGGVNQHPTQSPDSILGVTAAGDQVGNINVPPGCCSNIIFDHISVSWVPDDLSGVYGHADLVTYQWSLIGEPLTDGGKGFYQGKCHLIGGSNLSQRASVHHNIFLHCSDRNPMVHGGSIDLVNNLVYNWFTRGNFAPITGPVLLNAVGNYYLRGLNSVHSTEPIYRPLNVAGHIPAIGTNASYAAASAAYFQGNIEPLDRPNNSLPEMAAVNIEGGNPIISSTRLNFPLVTTTDAFQAKTDVLANAGARVPAQDAVDIRLLNHITTGTGQHVINNPSEVGGYPALAQNTRPVGYDTDGDGMPDSWELAHGLDPKDPTDGARDAGDGYTNLEKYLNNIIPGIAVGALPAPKNLTSGGFSSP